MVGEGGEEGGGVVDVEIEEERLTLVHALMMIIVNHCKVIISQEDERTDSEQLLIEWYLCYCISQVVARLKCCLYVFLY